MRRRDFISLIGGAATAWPLAAGAQQERVRRIGVLMNLAEDDPEASARISSFVQRLSQLGWTEGRNLQIENRWAAGESERYGKYAAELVALGRMLSCVWQSKCSSLASGDPNSTYRIRKRYRPGWQRVRQ